MRLSHPDYCIALRMLAVQEYIRVALESSNELIERKIEMSVGQLTEHEVEQEIVNKGKNTGPRLTPQAIDALIRDAHYWRVPGDTMTVCALTLVNGYTVIGEAACVSPENFDEEIGRKVARDRARDKIWPLAGYALANEQWTIQRVEELQARDMLDADLAG